MRTWEARDPTLGRPIAAPLAQCAQLLGVDLATLREVAANVEPYIRTDGSKIWSLLQLERQLGPEAFRRRRGGFIDLDAPQPAMPNVAETVGGSARSARPVQHTARSRHISPYPLDSPSR